MSYESRIPLIVAELETKLVAALRVGAEQVANEAKARVPVATGGLRDSIHTDMDGNDVYVIAGDENTFYGHLVEHGTTRTPARPFLVPALEARKDSILAGVKSVLADL